MTTYIIPMDDEKCETTSQFNLFHCDSRCGRISTRTNQQNNNNAIEGGYNIWEAKSHRYRAEKEHMQVMLTLEWGNHRPTSLGKEG